MLSGKELLQHTFFSSLAALVVLAGLYGAVHSSRATEVNLTTDLLTRKMVISCIATIVFAITIFLMQKVDLRIAYSMSLLLMYLPAFICLGWAAKIYVRGVLTI